MHAKHLAQHLERDRRLIRGGFSEDHQLPLTTPSPGQAPGDDGRALLRLQGFLVSNASPQSCHQQVIWMWLSLHRVKATVSMLQRGRRRPGEASQSGKECPQ